ncbi:MAG: hypothetical protein ACOCV0_06175 [Alkalispirochaeta sp.]
MPHEPEDEHDEDRRQEPPGQSVDETVAGGNEVPSRRFRRWEAPAGRIRRVALLRMSRQLTIQFGRV